MRTGNKGGSLGFVHQVMVYALVAISCSASIGLGTVWMRHQISLTANINKVLEAQVADLERRIEETDAAIASEQDPGTLNRRNIDWRLGLVPPNETQIRRITEDSVKRLEAIQNRKLFGERPATVSVRVALAH